MSGLYSGAHAKVADRPHSSMIGGVTEQSQWFLVSLLLLLVHSANGRFREMTLCETYQWLNQVHVGLYHTPHPYDVLGYKIPLVIVDITVKQYWSQRDGGRLTYTIVLLWMMRYPTPMLFIDMSRDMTEPTALCQSRRLATLDVVTSALDNFVANNMVKKVDTMM